MRNTGYDYEQTDGRGNTTRIVYDSLGRVTSTIDALGYSTIYGYNALGRQTSVTDPLTNTVTTAYDAEGHVLSQRGAIYPVDYAYDEFGDKISMTTYRDINNAGDVTRWLRDEATGLVTNKVYADGKGPKYTYTPDGKLATRTWARGIVTTYSYDDNGSLTNTVYSDGTPTISLAYNRAGRQIEAHDAAGVTAFAYDSFGAVTYETVVGVAGTNTIERYYDSVGRSLGYALNGVRQSTLAYDPATGRLASMLANGSDTPFVWNYLAGSDLKSSLVYPNGLTASWQYDANGQLLQVKNAFPTNTISQYDYVYDAAGRRINVSKSGTAFNHDDTIAYGYNEKSELTNAVAAVDSDYRYSYDFDDIGNRETSSERGTNSVYTANQLNQYTAVDDFTPQFDDDGNQTLIKTSTGIWSLTYNGENRPVRWESGNAVVTMSFDRMGRRVMKNDQRFVFDGYLQIADNGGNAYIWDSTEPFATRPLVWNCGASVTYYAHDGNKNVSEVVAENDGVAAHYEYAPFGTVTAQRGASAASNPWRFSSEYGEDDTATAYYNYRHYESMTGRWMSRDPIEERGFLEEQRGRTRTLAPIHESSIWSTDVSQREIYDSILRGKLKAIKNGVVANEYLFVKNRATSGFCDLLGLHVYVCIRPVDRKPVTWMFVHAFFKTDKCGNKGYFPAEATVPNPDVPDEGGVVTEPHPEGTGGEKSRCVKVNCPCLDEAKFCQKIEESKSSGSWDGEDWSRIFHNCAHWTDMILKSQGCKGVESHFPGYRLPPAWPRY